jgi:hypothetical protein
MTPQSAANPAPVSTASTFCTACGGQLTEANTHTTADGVWHMTSEPHKTQKKTVQLETMAPTTTPGATMMPVGVVVIVPPDVPASVPPGNAKPLPADHPMAHLNPAMTGASAAPASQSEAQATAAASTPAPATETAPKATRKKAASTADGIALYVNCLVEGAETKSLEGYVADLLRLLAERGQVPDIRFAYDEKHPFAFGKWKAALAEAVRRAPPANGAWSIQIDGDDAKQVVVNALRPLAATYVKGMGS